MGLKSWRRVTPIAAVTLLIAGVAAGCGGDSGGDGGSDATARTQFNEALSPQALGKLDSGVLDATIKMDGDDVTANVHVTGPFESGKGSDLTLDADSDIPDLSGSATGEIVTVAGNLFIVAGGSTYELGKDELTHLRGLYGSAPQRGGFRVRCEAQARARGGDPSICSQIHPRSWLKDFSDEGEATVAGVKTTHLSADVDVKTMFREAITFSQGFMPGGSTAVPIPPGFADQISDYVKEFNVDVYQADDGIPRRLSFEMKFDAGDTDLDFSADASFADVNEPQTINPPPGPAKPMSELAAKLPPPLPAFFDCLTTAASAEALQACSAAAEAGATGGLGTGLTGVGAGQFVPN